MLISVEFRGQPFAPAPILMPVDRGVCDSCAFSRLSSPPAVGFSWKLGRISEDIAYQSRQPVWLATVITAERPWPGPSALYDRRPYRQALW